jgi:hypothetical protein
MAYLILRALILKSMRWVGVVLPVRMTFISAKVVITDGKWPLTELIALNLYRRIIKL